ncbi:MAG: 2-oxoglutarate dehydrogenase E1 component [Alphaproteobacteria bacterium]|nr:2-oxoglutarate dehydrogenase E1 component [Alphaproteobacteria bacterium]
MTVRNGNDFYARTSFLHGANASYLEDLFARYQQDPLSVDEDWRAFFSGLADKGGVSSCATPSWKASYCCEESSLSSPGNGWDPALDDGKWPTSPEAVGDRIKAARQAAGLSVSDDEIRRQTQESIRAFMLILAYRTRGHLEADLDPLGMVKREACHPELDPVSYGFGPDDLDHPIFIDKALGLEFASLRQIQSLLRRTYCSKIGVEFMHISDPDQKAWLQARIEGPDVSVSFTQKERLTILDKLIEAEGFESFLDLKYTGTKRFGLDGSEAMIPALEEIIRCSSALGAKELVLGMSHRGRLNVLTQVLGKPHRALFNEFKEGSCYPETLEWSGDVKYHLGASSDRSFDDAQIHLSLAANPSHLEIINPVVLGKVRAKQEQHGCTPEDRRAVIPLLIHGDAAFAGQGVVAECFGLSGLRGHRTGGSIHFIVNNQIGFTASPHHTRSSPYPSDVAKMIDAPIFHVNGDDPEAVVHVSRIATAFRQTFQKPVIIDMFCYRRFGHNEGDEPFFTQPGMYRCIRDHKKIVEIYGTCLSDAGVVSVSGIEERKRSWRQKLDGEFKAAATYKTETVDWLSGAWSGVSIADRRDERRVGKTGLPLDRLKSVGLSLCSIPSDFNVHPTIRRFLDKRKKMVETGVGIDWSLAEALAFGTLLQEGHRVRLSGQDSERGTFSHRHSVLTDQETEARYTPLNHLEGKPAHYEVINSILSEEAVLGFEYGYSLSEPNALTLWEAQFGDFSNGAQVIFDQFISSGERKWLRMSGLVCLLPHGYEGQGPEHSSARLERYLQMCAEDNMQVANCTTPANYFHILRRQLCRPFRKPLLLMTPKSLLRHKRAVSTLEAFGPDACFHRVLWDHAELSLSPEPWLVPDPRIRRVVLCSGRVYHDLYDEREHRDVRDVYLLRVEQLYPFPRKALISELSRFRQADIIWCQEEPQNMGAWHFVKDFLEMVLQDIDARVRQARYAGRPASAATATGQMGHHKEQLRTFLGEVFSFE